MARIVWFFIGALTAAAVISTTKGRPTEQVEFTKAVPFYMRPVECGSVDDGARRRLAMVADVLEEFSDRSDWMHIAAVKYFGRARCAPPDILSRVEAMTVADGTFGPLNPPPGYPKGYLHKDELDLAATLGPSHAIIVEAVAFTALHKTNLVTEYPTLKEDYRSYARTVLAQFGKAAANWSDEAYAQISAENALGTGAAQIAIAAGHAHALERVSSLMAQVLKANSTDPIPIEARDRLFELAYAIGFGGERAREYLEPILTMLGRDVGSWAGHYGIIPRKPRELCRVLAKIGGASASSKLKQEPCRSGHWNLDN